MFLVVDEGEIVQCLFGSGVVDEIAAVEEHECGGFLEIWGFFSAVLDDAVEAVHG